MIIEATDANFETLLTTLTSPVIVDFWAPWCTPCKGLNPILEAVALEFNDRVAVIKVNIDETDIAKKHNIRSVPTLVGFKAGSQVSSIASKITKQQVIDMANALIA